MKRTWKSLILAGVLSLSLSVPAFAGSWQSNANGYWYQNDDGTYPVNCWQWIDGNNDGIAESYYFNEQGYILVNTTTPDGYTVDANGAWIIDGIVQTQTVILPPASTDPQKQNTPASTQGSAGISSSPYDGYTIVVNTNTKKYHNPGCASVKDISQHNIGYASDSNYLESQGYAACKRCH